MTPRGGRQLPTRGYSLVITSSRGPDQELQRWQRVYRQLGVQQALVRFQKINRKRSRLFVSVEKYFRPFWSN